MTTHQKTKYGLYGIFLIIIVLIGIGLWNTQKKEGIEPTAVANSGSYEVQTYITPDDPAVGDTITGKVEFRKNGNLVDLESQRIFPHTAIISNNVADFHFYHEDHEFKKIATGTYTFTHTLTEATDYTMWIEMNNNQTRQHHGQESDYVGRLDLAVFSAATEMSPPQTQDTYTFKNHVITLHDTTVRAGVPQQLRLTVKNKEDERVPVMDDFDHFYVVASPQNSFYVLDHPDHEKSTNEELVTSPITFPSPGTYAFWIRIFTADENNNQKDWLTGKFIVEVTD